MQKDHIRCQVLWLFWEELLYRQQSANAFEINLEEAVT